MTRRNLFFMMFCLFAGFILGCGRGGKGNADNSKATTPKITQEAVLGTWKAPGGGDFKEVLAYFNKDGSGAVRGVFGAGGGIRWEFTYEIDAKENTIKIYQEGKSRGTAQITDDSKLHMKVPKHVVFGDECLFTRSDK